MNEKTYPPINIQSNENYYWQHREFDFDPADRMAILPHASYSKYNFAE
jgi:hypothetical protein